MTWNFLLRFSRLKPAILIIKIGFLKANLWLAFKKPIFIMRIAGCIQKWQRYFEI